MKQYLVLSRSAEPRFSIKLGKKRIHKGLDIDALVGKAFLGEKKANEVYAHINKDRLDNISENLVIRNKGYNYKLNYKFSFIRLSDNKTFLRNELGKEYKKPDHTALNCINQAIRTDKKCYGSFWRKEFLPVYKNKSTFSNIRMDRISKDLKKQIDSAYTQRYVFNTNKKDEEKKHIIVFRYKMHHEKRRVKLTESERRKYAGFNTQLEDLKGEKWEDVPDYDGVYCVSNFGRVKSYGRYRANGSWWKEKIRKQNLRVWNKERAGLNVALYQNNTAKHFQVSNLVGMTFIRERKSNEVYAHFNKDQLDNRLENIKIITRKESRKLDFEKNVSLSAKHEFIRLADGKRFLYRDIIKQYGSDHVLSEIYRASNSNIMRYGSFWAKRRLK